MSAAWAAGQASEVKAFCHTHCVHDNENPSWGQARPSHRNPFSTALGAMPRPPPRLLTECVRDGDRDKEAESSIHIFQKFPKSLVCAQLGTMGWCS